jgi:hypothetical protein
MIETSITTYSRGIGVFLILTVFGGWFGEMYVPSHIMTGDAVATVAQLKANDGLFRLGFAAYLVEAFSDLVLSWLFYVVLRPVHRELALLSAFFGIVSMSLFAVTQMFYFSAPIFLSGKAYLTAFSPAQLEGLTNVFLSLYARLSDLFMLLYGTAWIIRGYLTFRSGYLPRSLGAVMMVGGLGFVAKNVTKLLLPEYSSDMLLAPMFFTVVASAIWMLFRGVNLGNWRRAVAVRSNNFLTET